MNRKTLVKNNLSLWITVGVCLFTILIAVTAVITVAQMNGKMEYVKSHPFDISRKLTAIQSNVDEMNLRMNRLVFYSEQEDVDYIAGAIDPLYGENAEMLQYIRENFAGNPDDVVTLGGYLDQIKTEQSKILQIAAIYDSDTLREMIAQRLDPLFAGVNDTVKIMMTFVENRMVTLVNDSKDALIRMAVITFSVGAITIGIVIWFYFITRKRTQEIYNRDFLFGVLAENADSVFIIYRLQNGGVTEFVSSNSKKILGLDSATLSADGQLLCGCLPKEEMDLYALLHGEKINKPAECEFEYEKPDTKEKLWLGLRVIPVLEKGEVHRYVIAINDLSEQKRGQQVLRDALVGAQRANRAKTDFLSRMSHEIRTPMNAIIGMTTIAATKTNDPERIEDCLSKIGSSAKMLLMLINDVLDMSKIENGNMTISHEAFNLRDLIDSVSTVIYPLSKIKEQKFDVILQDVRNEILVGDQLRVHQVLMNILSNAVKFTNNGGSISLHVRELFGKNGTTRFRFTFEDTGIGMSEEFLSRIFEPFEQENGTISQKVGGTGLGMAITKNVVTLMNGVIRVSSEPNSGTCFVVELPFETVSQELPVLDAELEDLKVLIVDDDRDTCAHTSILLERMGIAAEWVLSGEEAVSRVYAAHDQGRGYDVCIIDWRMPQMDGVETTRRIRERVGPETLIIVISAYDWTEIEASAREAGANAFISKPMFQSTLYNLLISLTGGHSAVRVKTDELWNFSGKKILLAEDNELNMEIASELLAATGAQILCAEDGERAVERFAASSEDEIDAILMDIQMPIMDGYQATRTIRSLDRADAQTVPIIAMTANAFAEDVSAALEAGMNAHIAKPIDIAHVCKILDRQIKNRKNSD